MGEFRNQLRQVFRRLVRAPMFTAITLITLAAGVGANTVVFSVLEGVLLKPLPYPRTEDLVGIWQMPLDSNQRPEYAPSNLLHLREQGKAPRLGPYQNDSVSVTGVAEPEQVPALRVTDGALPLLGIPPPLGRTFTKEDDSPGAPTTAFSPTGTGVTNSAATSASAGPLLWTANPLIIGISLNDFVSSMRTTGRVMPFRAVGPQRHYSWQFSYEAFGWLKPGVTIEQVNADWPACTPLFWHFPGSPGLQPQTLSRRAHRPERTPAETRRCR